MPTLKMTHSIAHWNILLGQMGLSALFDPIGTTDGDVEGGDGGDEQISVQSFAGMGAFPLASVTQLQHQTVLEVGVEDSSLEESSLNPSTASVDQGGQTNKPTMVQPRPKTRPLKRLPETAAAAGNRTRIVRVAKRSTSSSSSSSSSTTVVQSTVMKVLEQRTPHYHHHHPLHHPLQQQRREPLISGQSRPVPVTMVNTASSSGIKRPHVNLEEEEFIYLVLDNISGLVIAMGKYRPAGERV